MRPVVKTAVNKLTEQMADEVLARSGLVLTTPELARAYGFIDVGGSQMSAFWQDLLSEEETPS